MGPRDHWLTCVWGSIRGLPRKNADCSETWKRKSLVEVDQLYLFIFSLEDCNGFGEKTVLNEQMKPNLQKVVKQKKQQKIIMMGFFKKFYLVVYLRGLSHLISSHLIFIYCYFKFDLSSKWKLCILAHLHSVLKICFLL